MGTCQGKISKGDVMVVVAGLSMPLILTPFGNLFHLVGHAYSHGIMNGEAWPKDRNELRIITIV
jgi:hypothetical protein